MRARRCLKGRLALAGCGCARSLACGLRLTPTLLTGVVVALVLAAAGPRARADTLALKDGRFFEGKPIEVTADGYVVKFKHGAITVPSALVDGFFKGKSGTYVPVTPEEKVRFAKGLARWKGRWVRIPVAERERKKAFAAREKRMEQMKARRFWRNHAEVKTKRFVFKHTLPDAVFLEFKDLFEAYYTYFTKYWRFKPSPKFGTVTINIYHNREYFEQVSGAPRGVIGYYMPTERDLHFYFDRNNKAYTIDVMFHEGNHMLAHMINRNRWYPWWIGEGMAEYFGASEWNPATKTMKLGRLQAGRLAVLHAQIGDDKWVKLMDLLKTQGMGAVGYSWAWSLCHFLLHTPKYSKGFKRFFMAIGRDSRLKTVARFATIRQLPPTEVVEAFKRYVRVKDMKALEQEWYDYIKTKLSLDGRADVNWVEAGWIMSMYGQRAKARLYYKRAIDKGAKSSAACFGYAELKLLQNMPGIALKYAKKAVELDPLHARAWALQGRARFSTDEHDEEAMRLLELAHEIDPDDQDIWFKLEFARQRLREKKEAEAKKKNG